ncbi:MAG: sugar phosphate nucleotidyltransferase [Bacteroidota bacterium]
MRQSKLDQTYHIHARETMRTVLERLNQLPTGAQLFVLDQHQRLIGTISDRDIRNGLLRNLQLDAPVQQFMDANFAFVTDGNLSPDQMSAFRNSGLKMLPLLDEQQQIIELIDLAQSRSSLPLDVLIMAGGQGQRLRPYTQHTPKPLLPLGDQSIVEHLIQLLGKYGIRRIHLCTRYQHEQIQETLENRLGDEYQLSFHREEEALGTIGGARLIDDWTQDNVLILNADLLTNINLAHFFAVYQEHEAEMAIAATRFEFQVPFAVLDTHYGQVYGIDEKPKLSYQTNAGIYLLKREQLAQIPTDSFYNATDLVQKLIEQDKKVISVPLDGYWLDIGTPEDYRKAQEDIRHLDLN